ncbi:GapA-binding peptide SR1P [Paenibacillus tyrfis]|uniref:GapA-binding peptide SR1P n=1 Tax=Paenibacillus tyrfis TaxID=1501230 RepID=UPI00055F1BE9|nr:GapA-binding peptide SR1P [Paenibacillus tyrfis]
MERSPRVAEKEVHLGTILCKHCHQVIGTQDTRKVTVYYSECSHEQCLDGRGRSLAADGSAVASTGSHTVFEA